MNILFYVDAHIIRQNPLGYAHVLKRLYETCYEYSVNGKKYKDINFKILLTQDYGLPLQDYVATIPDGIYKELLRMNCKWDDLAIKQWELLMRGEGIISELYYDILNYLMKKYSVDVFIYWGSNGTVRKFADSFNIYSFAMELGPTRPPFFQTAYFDPLGVNGDSYSTRLLINDFEGIDINSLYYNLEFQNDFFSLAYKPIISKSSELIYNKNMKVLLPLQLDDDSNCILHSDFNGMEDFLKKVVPELIENKYTVFIKPHPSAHPSCNRGGERQKNVDAHQKCKEFIENEYLSSGCAIWLDDINKDDYLSMLTKMDAVITVNSSVGFEALLLGKLVIPLGKSPYNVSNSLPTFDDFIQNRIDQNSYNIIAGKIANIMLKYYLYPMDILDDIEIMIKAINRGISISDSYRSGGYKGLNSYIVNHPIEQFSIKNKRKEDEKNLYIDELYSVYTSRSWRYTALLRKIGRIVKKILKMTN